MTLPRTTKPLSRRFIYAGLEFIGVDDWLVFVRNVHTKQISYFITECEPEWSRVPSGESYDDPDASYEEIFTCENTLLVGMLMADRKAPRNPVPPEDEYSTLVFFRVRDETEGRLLDQSGTHIFDDMVERGEL